MLYLVHVATLKFHIWMYFKILSFETYTNVAPVAIGIETKGQPLRFPVLVLRFAFCCFLQSHWMCGGSHGLISVSCTESG